jgi:hypothetical protein
MLFVGTNLYAANGDLIVNGSVGIGVTNTSAKLEVKTNAQSDWAAVIQNISTNNPYGLYLNVGSSSSGIPFRVDQGGAQLLQVANNGDVLARGQFIANQFQITSDAKFKKDLQSIHNPLDKVIKMNGISYEWKRVEYSDMNFPQGRHYGVIAQEMEKVLPEVVNTASDGTKSVAYPEIIPVLIEAIKEQQKEIEQLKKIILEK